MKKLVLVGLAAVCATATASAQAPSADVARWQRQAQNVTITRDDWGIAHVRGHTDADAVFGMIYAQAEDDFNRIEVNYLTSIGRTAEAEGEKAIWQDLRQRLFIDPDTMKVLYARSPAYMQKLMNAWADGLNYYLYTHPDVKPRVITHFEPWMPLTFSEGSIGGDIERVDLRQLAAFYGHTPAPPVAVGPDTAQPPEPRGSNGAAIAPMNTIGKHAMLLINPHTSFFFRSELQMTSDEGLNAYGAVTWGQFFIYQGWNPRAGWMHTSSGVDNIDEWLETVVPHGDGYAYRWGNQERPVRSEPITLAYRTSDGSLARRTFTAYFTHHGPIVREANGKWVSIGLMNDPMHALIQSYTRTKAKNLAEFRKIMELHTNSSNNTLFADADGNIAYFHSNFIPRRDTSFDWRKPVDGSDPRTDWRGVLSFAETPNVINPPNGWVYNTNNWPWSAAGPYSPKRENYPKYVENGTESPRGRHAIMVLENRHRFTLDTLISAAFDSYLPAFAELVPVLVRSYDALPATDSLRARLREPIDSLRHWNYRWGYNSVPTSLAVFYGETLGSNVGQGFLTEEMAEGDQSRFDVTPDKQVHALAGAVDRLTRDFGTWKTPWGNINRFQRLTGDIVQPFNDAGPSIPVPFTSARWGSLASFGARPYPGTKKWYGTSGNSFVAVVEFGPRVRARAVTAGGESGHPSSPHFNDEAKRYADGALREVYFYPDQLRGHTERVYHPGR
jgi:acyl-homoserine-lactone acylase